MPAGTSGRHSPVLSPDGASPSGQAALQGALPPGQSWLQGTPEEDPWGAGRSERDVPPDTGPGKVEVQEDGAGLRHVRAQDRPGLVFSH